MALPRGAVGLSANVFVVFPDHLLLKNYSKMCPAILMEYVKEITLLTESFDHTYLDLHLDCKCVTIVI